MTPEEMKDEFLRAEEKAHTALRTLMKICWRHTKDDTGEKLSIRAYAQIVGRPKSVIHRYAQGYKLLLTVPTCGDRPNEMTPFEACLRADMTDDKQDAVDAIKAETGLTFPYVAKTMAPQIKEVQVLAKERAEQSGTTPREELPAAAQAVVAAAKSQPPAPPRTAQAPAATQRPPAPAPPRTPQASAATQRAPLQPQAPAAVEEPAAQPKTPRKVTYELAERALGKERGVTYVGVPSSDIDQDIAHVQRLAQTLVKVKGKTHEDAAEEAARFVASVKPSLEETERWFRNLPDAGEGYIWPPIRDALRSMRQAVLEAEKTYCNSVTAAVIGIDLFEIEQLVSRVRSLISAVRVAPGKPRLVTPQIVTPPASPTDAGPTTD